MAPRAMTRGNAAATTPRNEINMKVNASTIVTIIMVPKSSSSIFSNWRTMEVSPAMTISKPPALSAAAAARTVSRIASILSSASSSSPAMTTWASTTWPSSDSMDVSPVS